MKRKTYHIKQNGQVVATRHSWNYARIEIRNQVRKQLTIGETAARFAYDYERDATGYTFVKGVETWHTSGGRALVFEIQQVTEKEVQCSSSGMKLEQ